MPVWTAVLLTALAAGAADGQRNPMPYTNVAWDGAQHVHTTSHGHMRKQETLDRGYGDGMRFFTISNYYPSAPRCPMKDVREYQFHVRQDHAIMVKGKRTSGPFLWNDIIMDPKTGWVNEIPEELRGRLPFKVGGPVFPNVPGDILEAPNAEHHSFTDTQVHICAPGSAHASGNFDARSRFLLKPHGYGMGMSLPWREGFRLILNELVEEDGGGITVNHPVWSKLQDDVILDMLDFDPRVLGIEVFNHGCILDRDEKTCFRNEEVWDRILSSGRQCFGFFVPDHRMQGSTDWQGRNVLLVDAFTVADCLRAYRTGNFYGCLRGNGLRFEAIEPSADEIRVRTNRANRIEFITDKGIVKTVDAASGALSVPAGSAVFVRVKAHDARGETIFSQPMMFGKAK
ncbi:MAG: hypothetical protein GY851_23975 [bacterium]|nr:hypothetical protein [bacterium]